MNLILFDNSDLGGEAEAQPAATPSRFVLRDGRAEHIRRILKLETGATLRVGQIGSTQDFGRGSTAAGRGRIGQARIVDISSEAVHLEILQLDKEPPPPSPVELILALPRPKSLKRCLRAVANLGIKSIHLIHSIRVEKSYWTAPALDPAMLRQTLLEGLSIACDTQLPTVKLHRLFKPFVQDVAPHLVSDLAFVAHPLKTGSPDADSSSNESDQLSLQFAPSRRPGHGLIPVAIGPEGGFSDYEVGLFNEAGFKNLSLGSRIYSVECAVPVIESMVNMSVKGAANGRVEHRS